MLKLLRAASMRKRFFGFASGTIALVLILQFYWPPILFSLLVFIPLIVLGVHDIRQPNHTLMRNFPIFGRGRWVMEILRGPIRQYFIESDTDGVPINRMFRSVVYQRAKRARDTVPFGTKVDVYRVGYEWIAHSLTARVANDDLNQLRVLVGGKHCKQKYSASIFNVSAMSFGALSANAIESLNGGAQKCGCAHNTGEGAISPYHLKHGGDLIWQVGTGYFGCRDKEGNFNPTMFKEKAAIESVKMIEIKLSQGAKPGHGGILPANKNTPEIAAIRGVEAGTRVDSPPGHTAFSNPTELMHFIQQLRELSDGKPIGFKICVGSHVEFLSICKAMVETGIHPDFITVDGGEGGTGAAPLEYTNSIGMPLRDGLAFVCDCLTGFGLKDEIKVIASGKILTGFHIVKNLALGADLSYSARGMMLALGCIQALECNSNSCPTGIATQNPALAHGLVVEDKISRVANYHDGTVHSVAEIVAAAGLDHTRQLARHHIYRRVSQTQICTYEEIFPEMESGVLLEAPYPERFQKDMEHSSADYFVRVPHMRGQERSAEASTPD